MKGVMSIFLTLMNEVHGTIRHQVPTRKTFPSKRGILQMLFLLNFGLSLYKKLDNQIKTGSNLIR